MALLNQRIEDKFLSSQEEQIKPRLFALLVGINNYKDEIKLADGNLKFPRLYGCESDVDKIKNYIENDCYYDPDILAITNECATKKNIHAAFQDHLLKAGPDDAILFYYSGHGTQEFADVSLFPSETDGRLEALVCYFEDGSEDFLLTDKELRWLFGRISKNNPHIVAIFDCCHSGDNVRNGELIDKSFTEVVEKRVKYIFPQRNYNNFLFKDDLPEEKLRQLGETNALPESKLFHFAACESNEAAVEIGSEAVFTKTLLSILKQNSGNISYHKLSTSIRQYMRNVYEQRPKFYVSNYEQGDVFENFLNYPVVSTNTISGDVIYNEANGWILSLGALHGIHKGLLSFSIRSNTGDKFLATISKVFLDHSSLKIDEEVNVSQTFSAELLREDTSQIVLFIEPGNADLADQRKVLDLLYSKKFVSICDEEKGANYVLRFLNGRYYFTLPYNPFRPLAVPVELKSPENVNQIVLQVEQIAKWEFLKGLSNVDCHESNLSAQLKIEISVGDQQYLNVQDQETIEIQFQKNGTKWSNSLKCTITNECDEDLYCACTYLVSNFAAYTGYLTPQVKMLTKHETVPLARKARTEISLSLDPIMQFYNWEYQIDYLKFFVSRQDFDATSLDFDGLPMPDLPQRDRHLDSDYSRDYDYTLTKSGWQTKMVALKFINPLYNKISNATLQELLSWPPTTDFALGIYFDAKKNDIAEWTYEVKPIMQITESADRGFIRDKIIDLANFLSRTARNRFYEHNVERFSERIKIVSEGDSWFQHPLLLDIIDHLNRVYNVYCVAAAGDTLRNYFSKEKCNGQYFLDALSEKDPSFFLISGGGNDLLGSKFRTYLKIPQEKSNHPSSFLKQEFYNELDFLITLYKTLFSHLMEHKPQIHIIVHGYDYPIKLNDTKKGWLGRYMIEKGIDTHDRILIARHIIDTFNERLSGIASCFSNVTYLDLRNTIRYNEQEDVDQWHDEIHPNNEGFQQIATMFINAIDKIHHSKKALFKNYKIKQHGNTQPN